LASEIIKTPDLGDVGEVEVIEIPVSVGQAVAENDSLLVLESDKAAMEIPAPMGGVVTKIAVNLGDKVTSGVNILTLEVAKAATDAADAEHKASSPQPEAAAQQNGAATAEAASAPAAEAEQQQQEQAAATAKAEAAAASIEVVIPDIGSEDAVEVIEIHVEPGDSISVDEPLLTLESDKAAMEVPSPHAGVVESLLVELGAKVNTGSPVLRLRAGQQRHDSALAPKAQPEAAPVAEPRSQPPAPQASAQKAPASAAVAAPSATPASAAAGSAPSVYAGPAVRKLARELGVDLAQVEGSGARGRIVKEDVQGFVKQRLQQPAATSAALPALPEIDFSRFGKVERVPRSKLARVTAANMQRNWLNVAHVAQFEEADVTGLEQFRVSLRPEAERRGLKLTLLPFLLMASARTLAEFPQFNVSLDASGETLVQKKYIHVGVAVATDSGLLVPVLRDVDRKSVWQLAEELAELSARARQRKLAAEDMQGASFTISSLGAIGGTGFIPIVNAPEVAILGVARTAVKPVWRDGEFVPRTMLPLTLSYDHRALNGVDGGRFATHLAALLGDIRRFLL